MIVFNKNIKKLADDLSQIDEIKGRSLWYDARVRFFKNKAAVTSLINTYFSFIIYFFWSFICSME